MSEEEKNVIEEIKKSIEIQDRLNNEIRKTGAEPFIHSKKIDIYRVVLNLIKKQDKEIENWQKIAEELANTIHTGILSYNDVCDKVSDEECNKRRCYQCIIDWARKEVEKDGQ